MAGAETLEYPLARPLKGKALRHLLPAFRLVRRETRRTTRWLLDTHDWRLWAAGLEAELDEQGLTVRHRADGRLEGRCGAVAPPAMASALDDAGLRERLAVILGPRALLAVAGARLAATAYDVRDGSDQVVARLRLEERRLLGPAGKALRPRERALVVEPVAGHDGTHKALRKALKGTLPAPGPAPADPLRRALEAAPRRAGTSTSKLDVALDPGQRADAAMKQVLGHLLAAMADNEAGMLARLDPEFLHDYRVAVRRTRSALTQVKGVFPGTPTRRLREDLAWLGAVTGPARDMDVYLLAIEDFRALLEPALQPHLDALAGFLEERRGTAYDALRRALGRARYRRAMAAWRDFLDRPVPRRPAAPHAARPIKEVADRRIWKAYRRVMSEGEAVGADSPPADLHELRKSCKKLRYLMEFFGSLYGGAEVGGLVKTLKRFQDNLGEFQDLSVQMDHLAGFEAEMAAQSRLDAGARAAIDQLLERLEARRGAVRADFDARFAAFAGEDIRQAFRDLFRPPAT